MRDDLHRTVPLSRAWRPVMKFIGREADWQRVPAAMSKAVRKEIEAGLERTWVTEFKKTLALVETDLFGSEHCVYIFDDFERRCPTLVERQICEMARGLVARDGTTTKLYDRAVVEVCRHSLPAHIAHLEAQVRARHGVAEATQFFEKLTNLSRECKFESNGLKVSRSSEESISDLLNEPIALNL